MMPFLFYNKNSTNHFSHELKDMFPDRNNNDIPLENNEK